MTITLSGLTSHSVQLTFQVHVTVRTPQVLLPKVWPLPLSLATTRRISFDFSSSRYLDVSVPGVLFTFPSQYFSTIGHQVVFRLGGWSPHLLCGFHVSADTLDTVSPVQFSLK